MYVFRSGRRDVPGPRLVAELADDLRALAAPAGADRDRGIVLRALIRAGELESILADAGAASAPLLARLTDELAAMLVGGAGALAIPDGPTSDHGRPDLWPRAASRLTTPEALAALAAIDVPAMVPTSPPEGFSFYALHPLDFARLAEQLASSPAPVRVVGIRSIGTTLSAVTAAALRWRGIRAGRITARPSGHPYDRRVELGVRELAWVEDGIAEGAQFWVADEGPGFSGSSFLSTGDALVGAGVPRGNIVFLGSRAADPDALVAPDGARRWRSFRAERVVGGKHVPTDAGEFIGAGTWRRRFYDDESRWPPSWTSMERFKSLSRDGSRILKFEGMGRYGAECLERARGVARAGFGPAPRDEGEGFLSYRWLPGRPLEPGHLSTAVLERLADYCAFRASAFPVPSPTTDELITMARTNFSADMGNELPAELHLEIARPVLVDGKMDPHEWLGSASGELFKVDAAGHGDDHFLPGPTDIAWDLAGAIVEWRMAPEARRAFLDRYRRRSGDDPERRLPAYLLAYALLRLGYAAMAAASLPDEDEARRLAAARHRYRSALLGRLAPAASRGALG
ncbi:hypothetical protein BE21_11660 [Sorangium cellulosum]|uniref:Uncharacterized protein n=1 Tax=Sorangium cellulosum TaxID=56 RepID=A0A150U104_SORCE|nr:hypothetical protein BE21_11660 [Sorangium cellulosum]